MKRSTADDDDDDDDIYIYIYIYQTSGSRILKTTIGIQPGLDALKESSRFWPSLQTWKLLE